LFPRSWQEAAMNGIIYLIGLIVVILAILSFFGLR
jgi:predicted membrane channel-forming protein YqfA (hemolysin III family)